MELDVTHMVEDTDNMPTLARYSLLPDKGRSGGVLMPSTAQPI
jgi:hypothetical protein